MKSYCVRERRQTDNVPGSEQYVKTRNNRTLMKSKCASCGITKTRFVSSRHGSGLASATKGLRAKAGNYLMSETTRNKIKDYGHKNLDKLVDTTSIGLAKKITGSGRTRGKGLLLGKNSPFNKIPLIGAIL